MAITFLKTSAGIKIYDTKDDSIVSLIDAYPVRIIAFQKQNSIELQVNGFSKLFQATDVVSIEGIPPAVKTAEIIADQLRELIFYAPLASSPSNTTASPITSVIINLTAGANIAPGQVLSIEPSGLATIYNIYDDTYSGSIIGIAMQSALIGQPIDVCTAGTVNVPGIGWIGGLEYYIGANGIPTTSLLTTPGINKQIGIGIAIDTILITYSPEVILS